MLDIGTLTGRLSATGGLTGRLTSASSVTGTITRFDGGYVPYTGEYEIAPDFTGTTLNTANRYMTDDVTVNPIQVESVSNLSGGVDRVYWNVECCRWQCKHQQHSADKGVCS